MSWRTRLVIPLLAAATLLGACTGKDAVNSSGNGQFTFKSATKVGTSIPVGNRKAIGKVTGTLIGGGAWSLSADAGKVVVVNYWASWCAPCRIETPQLDSLYRELKSQPITFVGIDTKDYSPERRVEPSSRPTTSATRSCTTSRAGRRPELGNVPASNLPFTVIIDKHERVAAVYLTSVLPADLRPVLTALAAES